MNVRVQRVGLALDFFGRWDLEFDYFRMIILWLLWLDICKYELFVLNLFFGGKPVIDDLVLIELFWLFMGGLLLHLDLFQ